MDSNADKGFSYDERKLADKVADEILEENFDKETEDDKKYFFLVLLFIICLIFLVSSVSFAVFDTYYNGSNDNSIDVNINVNTDVDPDIGDKDNNDRNKDKEEVKDVVVPSNPGINSGKLFFSYNSGSNHIDMDNVFPIYDSVGMNLTGDKQYFDFNIDAKLNDNSEGTLFYEISVVPTSNNTIDGNDVRVYLTENDKAVSVFGNGVNSFSDLPDSKYQKNGKVIYINSVKNSYSADYVFRMWLSSKSEISGTVKKFGCKIVVNAYYE